MTDQIDFAVVRPMLDEHARVEAELASPEVHAQPGLARRLGRRYAELGRIVAAYRRWERLRDDLADASVLAEDDPDFRAEADRLASELPDAEEALTELLVPRDPDADRDVILEIKAGEGGDESALFASDLSRMYTRYAEARGWRVEMVSGTPSDLGGWRDVSLAVSSSSTDPDDGVWGNLRFEGGVHRVQRVPVTESQGRVHTSAAGVLVLPEVEEPEEIDLAPADLRIDVYRSSGPGGQSVNTTDSAVRITHVPTGIVASCQNEKSQLQNREQAMRILRARLLARQREEAEAEASAQRRSQIRSVDRSERIRTYNFPENRIVDHRTGYKAYNLDAVLDGALGPVIDSCLQADRQARMDAETDSGS